MDDLAASCVDEMNLVVGESKEPTDIGRLNFVYELVHSWSLVYGQSVVDKFAARRVVSFDGIVAKVRWEYLTLKHWFEPRHLDPMEYHYEEAPYYPVEDFEYPRQSMTSDEMTVDEYFDCLHRADSVARLSADTDHYTAE